MLSLSNDSMSSQREVLPTHQHQKPLWAEVKRLLHLIHCGDVERAREGFIYLLEIFRKGELVEARKFFRELLSGVFLAFPVENFACPEEYDRLLDGYLKELDEMKTLSELKECLIRQWEGIVEFLEGGGNRRRKVIAEALLFIERKFREPLAEGAVLRHLCVGKTWFTQAFRAETGKTFRLYLRRRRVEEACRLLRTTEYPLWRVAAESGFRTERTLRRAFHEEMGLSPREFRQI